VVALVGPRGVVESFALNGSEQFRVPMDMGFLPLYELTGAGTCVNVGNIGWRDISEIPVNGRLTVRVDNYRPFLSRATFYAVGDIAATPVLTEGLGQGTPSMTTRSFRADVAAEAAALTRSLADDQMAMPMTAAGKVVTRVEVSVNDNGDYKAALIALGISPSQIFARVTVDRDADRRATICGASSNDDRGQMPGSSR
jgi:hypothetical protein